MIWLIIFGYILPAIVIGLVFVHEIDSDMTVGDILRWIFLSICPIINLLAGYSFVIYYLCNDILDYKPFRKD